MSSGGAGVVWGRSERYCLYVDDCGVLVSWPEGPIGE